MQVWKRAKTRDGKLLLTGDLNVERAAELKSLLMDAVAAHDELEVDLSGVEMMDAAGLQVLLLAKRESAAGGRSLRLVAHSPAVAALFELYNVAGAFGDPLVLPAATTP